MVNKLKAVDLSQVMYSLEASWQGAHILEALSDQLSSNQT